MNIIAPAGIGDSLWSVTKLQDVAKKSDNSNINIKVAVWHLNNVEKRAVEFLKKFKFINSVDCYIMPHDKNLGPVLLPGEPADENGYYRYISDGKHPELYNIDYVLIPNAALERGIRLENWLPEFEINWNIFDEFEWTDTEIKYAENFKKVNGEYAVFFMASLGSNTSHGHNRMGIWTPKDWINLGDTLHKTYGLKIIVIGTTWDEDYFNAHIRQEIKTKPYWKSYISQWPIGHTLSIIKNARMMASYQSGLANCASYLNVPTVEFWRDKRSPKNQDDSIDPNYYISFETSMATAWVKPETLAKNRFMGAIYGRHGVGEILDFIKNNGW